MTMREKQLVSDAYIKVYQNYLDFTDELAGKKYNGEDVSRYMGAYHAMEHHLRGMVEICEVLDFDPINDI